MINEERNTNQPTPTPTLSEPDRIQFERHLYEVTELREMIVGHLLYHEDLNEAVLGTIIRMAAEESIRQLFDPSFGS
jgi:hypothetical protein